jgi:ectoine hydroxylase-related dioxygenase (phytanoyl-CoA dioxygenase family)
MNSNDFVEEIDANGVVLIKNCVDPKLMDQVKEEYNTLDSSLTRVEIEKDKPIIVFWRHVEGAQKRLSNFEEFPSLLKLIKKSIVPNLRNYFHGRFTRLQLLETVIFNKPPNISNTLNWHQDVSYFPLKPNNQVAVWIPFEYVDKDRSAMVYALGSHKGGIMGSINLHTREAYDNETRPLIPKNPETFGYEVRCMEMDSTDMLVHNGYTWHYTGPNIVPGYNRKGLSVRFIIDEATFDPRPGQGAAFTKQIDVRPGEIVKGGAFPLIE